jgi:hypothetical protein
MKDYKKLAARNFKTKRLKKKQITRLKQEHERLCKKHHVIGTHMTLSGEITPKEQYTFLISLVYSAMETFEKNKRGEILSFGSDGEGYFPKDQPGFVAK